MNLPLAVSYGANAPSYAQQRVGAVEVARSPDFDVAADRAGGSLHLIWRDGERILHISSNVSGDVWSSPQVILKTGAAGGPRMLVDGRGRVHLAYGVVKAGATHRMDGRIFYTMLEKGRWSEPVEALLPRERATPFQVCAPRIAIDGAGNVHVMGWNLVSSEQWMTDSRTAYARKPADADRFEATIEFSHARDSEGGGLHGDIVSDPAGNVHLFYMSRNPNGDVFKNATTHLVRFQDGRWSPRVDVFRPVATDMALRAAVDAKGVLHVVGADSTNWSRHKNPTAPIPWTYYNNGVDASELAPVHQMHDDWEYGTELLLAPNGDLWIARGSWEKGGPAPWLGRYARRLASTGEWTEPIALSPEGYRNADRKYGQVPKFAFIAGRVSLFYAEQAPGQSFKFYRRTFE